MSNRELARHEIVTYQQRLAPAFKTLNLQWLEGFDLLEPEDLKYLDHPQEMILDPGGQIFFALRDGEAVATCAVVPRTSTEWELIKLAVNPSEQGRGLGRRLSLVALDYAKRRGAKKAILVSSSKLVAAIRLYESLGFQHATMPADPDYLTADVYMELLL